MCSTDASKALDASNLGDAIWKITPEFRGSVLEGLVSRLGFFGGVFSFIKTRNAVLKCEENAKNVQADIN